MQGDPGRGLVLYNKWILRRSTILERGSQPTFRIVLATDAASGEGATVKIETVSIQIHARRARGRRFGSLVHRVIMDGDFGSTPVTLARLAQAHALRLDCSEEETRSAV